MSDDDVMRKVNYYSLEFDDQLALVGSQPFTGEVFAEHPDGTLEFRGSYNRGLPDGLQETWYSNGQLFHKALAMRGNGVSEAWTWYADGTPRSHRRYKDCVVVDQSAWDEQGRTMDPGQLDPDTKVQTWLG